MDVLMSKTMTFERSHLVELHKRYEANEKRGEELAKIAREELTERIGNRQATKEELAEVAMHEFQTIKAKGFKEAIEELFYIHDGIFEVK